MTKFDEILEALKEGKMVAIEKDRKTGEVKFGGSYDDDNDAALSYSADSPEGMMCLPPQVFFIKGIHMLSPSNQL